MLIELSGCMVIGWHRSCAGKDAHYANRRAADSARVVGARGSARVSYGRLA